MMKKIVFSFLALLAFTLSSCEKDNITNAYIDDNPDRLDKVASQLKETLASSPNGWVMMVKTSHNSDVFTPIVLQFDTVKNRIFIKTVYGEQSASESYYRISNGTGSPQLTFTTGSIMSSLYRVGPAASDITDHIYNVVSVSADTVAIRGYRSGRIYMPEGGVIYKMFRKPADWKWADNEKFFDFGAAGFGTDILNVPSTMRLEYVNTPEKNRTFDTRFLTSTGNLTTMRGGFPFQISRNIGTGGFEPTNYISFRFPYVAANNVTTLYDISPVYANNSLSFLPQVAGGNSNVAWMNFFINTFNFHYLVCKSVVRTGNNVKMEFEAYDRQGKVIVRAFYDNLL